MRTRGGVPDDPAHAGVAEPLTPENLARFVREVREREDKRPPPPVIVGPKLYCLLTGQKP